MGNTLHDRLTETVEKYKKAARVAEAARKVSDFQRKMGEISRNRPASKDQS